MNKLRDRVLSNNFCTYNPSSRPSFRRWDELDLVMWQVDKHLLRNKNRYILKILQSACLKNDYVVEFKCFYI